MKYLLALLVPVFLLSACASSAPASSSQSNDDLRGEAARANVGAACELSGRLLALSEPEGVRAEGYVWGRLASERGGCNAFDEAATRASLSEQEQRGADALYAEVSQLWRIMEMRPAR